MNELLKNESIASIKAMLDYVSEQAKGTGKSQTYWINVRIECQQELESRIKNIFP